MEIKKNITNVNRTKINNRKIEFIVIHWVGEISTAHNNTVYFKNVNRKASAHYFVDDNEIWQCVEDTDAAWHCGGGLQGLRGHEFYKKCLNANSIGVEMCCYNNNGTLDISDKTISNTIELVKELMKKYNIPIDRVIRHFDVTGKNCPAPFVKDESRWEVFKRVLSSDSKPKETSYTKGTYQTLYNMKVRTGAGTNYRAKSKRELTKDGQKHATIFGSYKAGTKFTAQEIINNSDGSVWAKSPSGYICIKDNHQVYCKKV